MMAYVFIEPVALTQENGWPALLIALAAKSILILGLATVVAFALRRAAAASRHLVWNLALVGLLLLPLLSLALQLTVVFPKLNVDPDAGMQFTETVPSTSSTAVTS